MMKSAGHTLLSSLKPPHYYYFPQKNYRRLPSNLNFGISTTKLRKLHAYHQKHQSKSNFEMVAEQYLPPWFSVAPMMEWTDNHYRTMARLVSKHAWLYTEMLAAETIIYQEKNLIFRVYSRAASYSTSNWWNCGCPSPKVAGHGCFGVSLMLDPKFVAEAMSAIAANTDVPVSVKCRIGVDDHDSYNELCDFIHKVSSESPTRHFVIHSRKALLNGISPADNRKIPPLKYEFYYALLRDFPDLRFTINGGINSIDEVRAAQNEGAHGVMVGRAAYNNSWSMLGNVDTAIYGAPPSNVTRRQVLEQYQIYADSVIGMYGNGKPNLRDLVKPLYGLFWGEKGNGVWKRKADSAFHHCKTFKSLMEETLVAMPDSVLDSTVGDAYSTTCIDKFANSKNLLPLPYTIEEEQEEKQELLYA